MNIVQADDGVAILMFFHCGPSCFWSNCGRMAARIKLNLHLSSTQPQPQPQLNSNIWINLIIKGYKRLWRLWRLWRGVEVEQRFNFGHTADYPQPRAKKKLWNRHSRQLVGVHQYTNQMFSARAFSLCNICVFTLRSDPCEKLCRQQFCFVLVWCGTSRFWILLPTWNWDLNWFP